MYHYVRKLAKSRYPNIKGLDLDKFIKQLDFLDHNYSFVRMEDCIKAIYGDDSEFPEDAVLMTFDDGYLEHYTEVFPILEERGIQGSFFPPVQSTLEHKVLDVNKIHFILASVEKPKELLMDLTKKIKTYQNKFDLAEPEEYYGRIESSEHPYDPMEIIIFKRVLQRELPSEARELIISNLFERYVGVPEEVFSNELYMNEDQLKTMIRHGMFVGGHGYSHRWLNAIDIKEQESEVGRTKQFLTSLGVPSSELVMCYPYGGYDSSLLEIMIQEDFVLGLTTKPEQAELSESNRFEMGRYDTNEMGHQK